MSQFNEIRNWLSELLRSSNFKVKFIESDKCLDWSFSGGKIVHTSNHFFKIVGIKYLNMQKKPRYQPIIHQWEIGTLEFLIRQVQKKNEILVQAKIEPGNVNIIQLAPTYQATKSNSMRYHGGDEPPLLGFFQKRDYEIISSSLQSEQGTRFLKKRNRNILVKSDSKVNFTNFFKWIRVDSLINLLDQDYLINTDARSVLICSDWEKLIGRMPFANSKMKFVDELSASYNQKFASKSFNDMKTTLLKMQKKELNIEIIPVNKLVGWDVNKKEIEPVSNNKFKVKYISISTVSREVKTWNQPIIDSNGIGCVDLICGRVNNILLFHFSIVIEPGLYNIAELSPTVCVEPGDIVKTNVLDKYPNAKILKSVLQSDEGGRFFQDSTRYRIIDIGQADLTMPGYWLNLSQIQKLLLKSGYFTNEARSVLSILLCWA